MHEISLNGLVRTNNVDFFKKFTFISKLQNESCITFTSTKNVLLFDVRKLACDLNEFATLQVESSQMTPHRW